VHHLRILFTQILVLENGTIAEFDAPAAFSPIPNRDLLALLLLRAFTTLTSSPTALL
jgi:hypothetical protein